MPIPCPATSTALLTLVLAGGALPPRLRLLRAFPDAAAALRAGPSAWRAAGCTPAQRARLALPDEPYLARGLAWLAEDQHHLLGLTDPDYPALLAQIEEPPLALFVDGEPARLWHPAVAVVGSRSPTPGGREHAHAFATALARDGWSVVSGLATGVDAQAHDGALQVHGGMTVAVVATGLEQTYPRQHAALHARIAGSGAVVSEYPPGMPAIQAHFPARNRIIAGLSLGTLVIEAAQRSGALITARCAGEAGREVFALPGSIRNARARGCHRLIRQGAALVEEPAEVTAGLTALAQTLAGALRSRLDAPTEQARPALNSAPSYTDPDYQCLWKALDDDPTGMDSLIQRSGLTAAQLSAMLLVMELDGKVMAAYGRYCRKP